MPSARFTPNGISSYWGSIARLGKLILKLETSERDFHVMGSLRCVPLRLLVAKASQAKPKSNALQ